MKVKIMSAEEDIQLLKNAYLLLQQLVVTGPRQGGVLAQANDSLAQAIQSYEVKVSAKPVKLPDGVKVEEVSSGENDKTKHENGAHAPV